MSRPDGEQAAPEEQPQAGWAATEVSEEFPELRLLCSQLRARPTRRSPPAVRARLRLLSNRFSGARAVNLRREPVPAAYRVFFRHIGLDPDITRPPGEAAVLERLLHGGFEARSLLDDALLIALVETGVPLWALDRDRVDGPLGIRVARGGESLGRQPEAPTLPQGRLVVADASSALAVLFGDLAPGHGVGPETRAMTLYAVQVAGVPDIHVEEALWTCCSVLVGV